MSIIDNLRVPHFLGFVIFDWAATIAGALAISYHFDISFVLTLIILLIISIFLHVIFKINTKTNAYLGLNTDQ